VAARAPVDQVGCCDHRRSRADQASADKKILFLPGHLPDGMEAADPMIHVRNESYPISFRHRQ
jgi:catalase